MGREDARLTDAKRSYRQAQNVGNRQEEARWANVIGDIFKNRGEYVEALRWLRLDYDISEKYLPEKQLLPSCQSLGEVLLRLKDYKEALKYQKKHLELAKDDGDLVEQQRASTQLGRTYHELFLESRDDHNSLRLAKKYFKSAMELAKTLTEKPPDSKSSFVKEYIDAHNNVGMLEIDLDRPEEALRILMKGLEICDEEEVGEDDDGRSRLYNNLGNVYMELRVWDEAKENIEKDIIICKRIKHCQGEAKGYINLGELHTKVQKYEDALLCYQKAYNLAKSMEDEDALVHLADDNISTVKEAIKVMDELKKEEQKYKKLARDMATARGTPEERKILLQQYACLDCLIEKSSIIMAWEKHCEFAKRRKRIASELCDKEKLGDSYLAIGESYQKLREFNKATKWLTKSWETYKSIGNLEGQALAKFSVGNVLDFSGNWTGALDAYEESYRIAVEANLPSTQLCALENMHYCNMMRFDNLEEARRLQSLIDQLKKSIETKLNDESQPEDYCGETDTEENLQLPNSGSDACCSTKTSKTSSNISKSVAISEGLDDDVCLTSLIQPKKKSMKIRTCPVESTVNSINPDKALPKNSQKVISNGKRVLGHKRARLILSDDEDDEMECFNGNTLELPAEDVATSECKSKNNLSSSVGEIQVAMRCNPKPVINVEESSNSHKRRNTNAVTRTGKDFRSLSSDIAVDPDVAVSGSKCDMSGSNKLWLLNFSNCKLLTSRHDQCIAFKIEKDLLNIESSFMDGDQLNIESLAAEVACLYYLQLPIGKRSEGLLPRIRDIKCAGRVIGSLETVKNLEDHTDILVEAVIDGWVQKRLIKMYTDCCKELSEVPNVKLLKKLYNLEVSDDEIVASECELQDLSVTPLLNALLAHKIFAVLDLSHNVLGNVTMEKLKEVFMSSSQTYGSLTLDLHCNRFGPTALFQICESSAIFDRLEVLNISGNRLTDACGSYLSTILKKCLALCSLNIERCHITTRTIQKVADALDSRSLLAQLSIGYNNPISRNAINNLLVKLSTLKRFSELNLSGIKLGKPVIDGLCQFARTITLAGLFLGSTAIGNDGAMQLTESLFNKKEELVKLDLSNCGLTSSYILNTDISSFCSIIELNLEGNSIMQEGGTALSCLLKNPLCHLKVLVLGKCQLGLPGILHIMQALAENYSLEELSLANNADPSEISTLNDSFTKGCIQPQEPNINTGESSSEQCFAPKVDDTQTGDCRLNTEYHQLEIADSEDVQIKEAATNDTASSCQRNSLSPECHFIQQLSAAIGMAKHLQSLDLSSNGFPKHTAETLYASWSTSSRAGCSWRHIKEQVIHFSLKENKCCRVKPCCKRD